LELFAQRLPVLAHFFHRLVVFEAHKGIND